MRFANDHELAAAERECRASLASMRAVRTSFPRTPLPPAKGDVLVVDDDAADRAIVKRCLQRQQVRVIEADSVIEAEMLISLRGAPSLILLDIGLPGDSGIGFLRRLRARQSTSSVPVVVLSGSGEAVGQALREKANALMIKGPDIARTEKQLIEVCDLWLVVAEKE